MERAAVILLIEDGRMDVELTLAALEQVAVEHQLHVATSGREGLDYVFGAGKFADREAYPLPSLILLDLKMSGIDGREVLQRVKESRPYGRIPVLILTSSREPDDLAFCYDHGANSYLVKPVSFQAFERVMRQVADYWLSLNLAPELDEERKAGTPG